MELGGKTFAPPHLPSHLPHHPNRPLFGTCSQEGITLLAPARKRQVAAWPGEWRQLAHRRAVRRAGGARAPDGRTSLHVPTESQHGAPGKSGRRRPPRVQLRDRWRWQPPCKGSGAAGLRPLEVVLAPFRSRQNPESGWAGREEATVKRVQP
jgi:hypothetical protein